MLAANFWNGGVWFLTFRYFRASTMLVDNYKCDESQIEVCGYWSTVMMMITAHLMFHHKLGLFGLLNLATLFQAMQFIHKHNYFSTVSAVC